MIPAVATLLLAALSPVPTAQSPYESAAEATPRGRIDELLFAEWQQLGIPPAKNCSDAVFLRRAFLELLGTLPTAAEARQFLRDQDPDRRNALIEQLLVRPEFALYQAMRWADLLRIKAEFPVNLWPNGAQAYHRWLLQAIARNLPYDRFCRQLLLATGSNFRAPEVNFWRSAAERTPRGFSRAAALLFLSARSERWPEPLQQGFANLFARVAWKPTREWKEEIVYCDLLKQAPAQALLPDGSTVQLPAETDPRHAFADWLLRDTDAPAAPVVCNRIWYWLFGRGLVHEPDDFRADNPPANPALLRYLASELQTAHWDLRHVYRLILRSQAWQLAPVPQGPDAAEHFACYPLRRMDAEVLVDALCQLTATTESYQSAIPEPFTIVPPGTRALALGDGSISSAVLELFGKSPRDTGLCAERSPQLPPALRLHLLNSSHVQQKLSRGKLCAGLPHRFDDAVDTLYLAILSRHPTAAERQTAAQQFGAPRTLARGMAEDLAFALINTTEFLYRH